VEKEVEEEARIAVIGTILAKWSRVRLRCIGGRGRRAPAIVEVADA
jgi:hypothetical protein